MLNKPLKKKEISRLINTAFRKCGLRETVIFADQLMQMGFRLATRAGISICVDDMLVPPQKEQIVGDAAKKVKEYDRQYMSGLVTSQERYNNVVDIWSATSEAVGKAMMEQLATEPVVDRDGNETKSGIVQLDLHDGRLGRAWFRGSDSSAGRYAWPDGEAGRLDHRDADHGELP